jgi:threonine/homoserine/homoserine lactone efflux protein
MPDTAHILLFLPAMLAVTLLPGPDMLFVMAQSARGGTRTGMISACGIISGGLVQIGGAILGLSALILKSALAFMLLKYAGAAYLIYLGVKVWREKTTFANATMPQVQPHKAFAQGFITNALNPKVTIFILAFLPQFLDVHRGSIPLQIAVFGAIWYGTAFCSLSTIAFGSHQIGRLFRTSASRFDGKKIVASIYIALGLAAIALPAERK